MDQINLPWSCRICRNSYERYSNIATFDVCNHAACVDCLFQGLNLNGQCPECDNTYRLVTVHVHNLEGGTWMNIQKYMKNYNPAQVAVQNMAYLATLNPDPDQNDGNDEDESDEDDEDHEEDTVEFEGEPVVDDEDGKPPEFNFKDELPEWYFENGEQVWAVEDEEPELDVEDEEPEWDVENGEEEWPVEDELPEWDVENGEQEWDFEDELPEWYFDDEEQEWDVEDEEPKWDVENGEQEWDSENGVEESDVEPEEPAELYAEVLMDIPLEVILTEGGEPIDPLIFAGSDEGEYEEEYVPPSPSEYEPRNGPGDDNDKDRGGGKRPRLSGC